MNCITIINYTGAWRLDQQWCQYQQHSMQDQFQSVVCMRLTKKLTSDTTSRLKK